MNEPYANVDDDGVFIITRIAFPEGDANPDLDGEPALEYGYFPSEEAARTMAEDLDRKPIRYRIECHLIAERNQKIEETNERIVAARDALIAAGSDPAGIFQEERALFAVPTFELWLASDLPLVHGVRQLRSIGKLTVDGNDR
ncbi:hypothetical protein ACFVAJ_17070 [Agromyces sp. NPDC057679]|uniref:hypothetical protein n=1 Tax=Agromyces sp. NPDC057679 TaxID=3346207 RepID=UPI00366D5D0F